MCYLGPPSTPPALDLQAGTSARVAWLRSSCEVSKASVGELTNCFSRVDRETGPTRWPRSLQKVTANLLSSFVLTQSPWEKASSYIDISPVQTQSAKIKGASS